jgi:hypothetical protein
LLRRPLLAAVTLTAASILATGCGGGDAASGDWIMFDACAPLAVVPDAAATDAQSSGLLAGMALWNDRAGTHLAVAADGAGGLPLHFQTAAPNFHGLYDAPRGQVFINNDLSGSLLAVTVAHEIGHAFGLSHVPPEERTSVMNPNNLVVEPTTEDVDTLAMRWGVCLASAMP